MDKQFSIQESFAFGVSTFRKRPWFFVGLTVLSLLVSVGFSFVVNSFASLFLAQAGEDVLAIVDGISRLLAFIFSMYVQIGITRLYLESVEGKTPEIREIQQTTRQLFFQYLFVSIISGAVTFVGYLLLIVPGIIISLMLQFAPISLIQDNNGFVHALQTSREITKGVKWKLLGFSLVSSGVMVLGVLCLGVGVLVAIPVITLAQTHVYRTLRSQTAL